MDYWQRLSVNSSFPYKSFNVTISFLQIWYFFDSQYIFCVNADLDKWKCYMRTNETATRKYLIFTFALVNSSSLLPWCGGNKNSNDNNNIIFNLSGLGFRDCASVLRGTCANSYTGLYDILTINFIQNEIIILYTSRFYLYVNEKSWNVLMNMCRLEYLYCLLSKNVFSFI
jgi:hypothetical protein